MKAFKGLENVRCIKLGYFLSEPRNVLQIEKEFSSRTVVKDQEEAFFVLEGIHELDNERVTDFF